MRSSVIVLAATSSALVTMFGCTSDPAAPSEDDYLSALQEICAASADELAGLPEPPEQITVVDFATRAAEILEAESEEVRRLDPPEDLDGDHRAFIRNTDEQAAAWRTVSADPDTLADVTDTIAGLTFGRNDLVDEMGAPDCRRGDQ